MFDKPCVWETENCFGDPLCKKLHKEEEDQFEPCLGRMLCSKYQESLVPDIDAYVEKGRLNQLYDAVSKPSHYTEGRKYEPKDVIRDWDLNFNLGNAVKYVARAGRKDDIIQDLKKARQYLDFEIDYLEQEQSGK